MRLELEDRVQFWALWSCAFLDPLQQAQFIESWVPSLWHLFRVLRRLIEVHSGEALSSQVFQVCKNLLKLPQVSPSHSLILPFPLPYFSNMSVWMVGICSGSRSGGESHSSKLSCVCYWKLTTPRLDCVPVFESKSAFAEFIPFTLRACHRHRHFQVSQSPETGGELSTWAF